MLYIYCEKRDRVGINAGTKAPTDIETICVNDGWIPLYFPPKIDSKKVWPLGRTFLMSIASWIIALFRVRPGDMFLIQYPMSAMPVGCMMLPLLRRKKAFIIILIHDLAYLRFQNSILSDHQKERCKRRDLILSYADKLICHNEMMKAWLIENGFEDEKLVNLEIFDYITEDNQAYSDRSRPFTVGIAGNLHPRKSGYVYQLDRLEGVTFHLYGTNFKGKDCNNIIYHGSVEADVLPMRLDVSFGLVWDGESVQTCEGNYGEYMRYNDPHKCSLYLASNIPVIIWKQAALAPFIQDNGLGITVSSLLELPRLLQELSEEIYCQMKKNVINMGKKIRSGYFIKQALQEIMNKGAECQESSK